MLRLEAEGGARRVVMFVLARIGGIEMVRSVELHAGFAGQHLEDATGGRLDYFCGADDLEVGWAVVNDPIVIVAGAELELFVGVIDVSADGVRLKKIKRGVFHIANFAGGNQSRIHGSVVAGEER